MTDTIRYADLIRALKRARNVPKHHQLDVLIEELHFMMTDRRSPFVLKIQRGIRK